MAEYDQLILRYYLAPCVTDIICGAVEYGLVHYVTNSKAPLHSVEITARGFNASFFCSNMVQFFPVVFSLLFLRVILVSDLEGPHLKTVYQRS